MTTNQRTWRQHPAGRVLSLLLASPLALLLLIHPAAFLDDQGRYSHSLLMLVMLGISGGFIHGVGFDPLHRLWRLLFGPVCAWPLLSLGYLLLAQAQGLIPPLIGAA